MSSEFDAWLDEAPVEDNKAMDQWLNQGPEDNFDASTASISSKWWHANKQLGLHFTKGVADTAEGIANIIENAGGYSDKFKDLDPIAQTILMQDYHKAHPDGKRPSNEEMDKLAAAYAAKKNAEPTPVKDTVVKTLRKVHDVLPEPSGVPSFDSETGKFIEGSEDAIAESLVPMGIMILNAPAGAATMYAQMYDQAYKQYIQQGASVKVANRAAHLSAVMQTPIEFMGGEFAVGLIKGAIGKKIAGTIIKKGASKIVLQIAKKVLEGGAAEGIEEYAQDSLQIAADEYAKDPTAPKEVILQRAAKKFATVKQQKSLASQTGQAAIGGGTLVGLGHGIVQAKHSLQGPSKVFTTEPTNTPTGEAPTESNTRLNDLDIVENPEQMNAGVSDEAVAGVQAQKQEASQEKRLQQAEAQKEQQRQQGVAQVQQENAQAAQAKARRDRAQAVADETQRQRDNVRKFVEYTTDRPGLNKIVQDNLMTWEKSPDPAVKRASKVFAQAQKTLAVGSDNVKAISTIQNDLRTIKGHLGPQMQHLAARLDEELHKDKVRLIQQERHNQIQAELTKAQKLPGQANTGTPYTADLRKLLQRQTQQKEAAAKKTAQAQAARITEHQAKNPGNVTIAAEEKARLQQARTQKNLKAQTQYRFKFSKTDTTGQDAADQYGMEYGGQWPEESGSMAGQHLFTLTEKTNPIFKGHETSINVKPEDISKLPEIINAKAKDFGGTPITFSKQVGTPGKVNPQHHAEITNTLNKLQAQAKNAIPIDIHAGQHELPSEIPQEGVKIADVYDPNTKRGHFVTSNLDSPATAVKKWLHLQVGHVGMRNLFRDDISWHKFLDQVHELTIGHPERASIERNYQGDLRKDKNGRYDKASRRLIAEEFLATKAESLDPKVRKTIYQKFRQFINLWLLKRGIGKVKITDKDVSTLLEMAKERTFRGELASQKTEKMGSQASKAGRLLKWNLLDVEKKAKAKGLTISDYVGKYGYKGNAFETTAYAKNLEKKLKKQSWRKKYTDLVKARADIASGKVKPLTPEYEALVQKYGAELEGWSIRHTHRFYIGKTKGGNTALLYGPKMKSDTLVKTITRTNVVKGEFTQPIYQDKAGNIIMDTPLFSTNDKTRAKQIDQLVQKNKHWWGWYQDWKNFMTNAPKSLRSKYTKIFAILSAGNGPQGNAKLATAVIAKLDTGKPLTGGEGTGVSTTDAAKINEIWQGQDKATTLAERQIKYGDKVGTYMTLGLEGTHPEGVVIDRHMPRLWGYDNMWNARGKQSGGKIAPEVRDQITEEIINAAKRNGTTPEAVQAALWYAARLPDVEASTYREAATLGKDYTPKQLYSQLRDNKVFAIHYGNDVYTEVQPTTSTEQAQSYSREVAERIAAGKQHPEYPHVPTAEFYTTGTDIEHHFNSKTPNTVAIPEQSLYNAVEDPKGYRAQSEALAKDPRIGQASRTNILSKLVKDDGYVGFISPATVGKGEVVSLFESAPVTHPSVTTQIGISDVVESVENLPQTLKELKKIAPKRFADFERAIVRLRRKYPELRIRKTMPTLARFGDVTSGKYEIGLAATVEGSLPAIRSFASELGARKAQNFVFVMHNTPAVGVKLSGHHVSFTIKKGITEQQVFDKLASLGLSDLNLQLHSALGEIRVDHYLDEEIAPEFAQFYKEMHSPGKYGEAQWHEAIHSEMIAKSSYKQHITHYLKDKGEARYAEAEQEGNQYKEIRRAQAGKYTGAVTESGAQTPGLSKGMGTNTRTNQEPPAGFRFSKELDNLTPSQRETMEHLGFQFVPKPGHLERMQQLVHKNTYSKFVNNIFDSIKPIQTLLEKGKDISGGLSAYKSFNMLSNFPAVLNAVLHDGLIKYQDHWVAVTPDKQGGLFTLYNALGNNAEAFFQRQTALSAQEMLNKGRTHLFGKNAAGEWLDDQTQINNLLDITNTTYKENKKLFDAAQRRLKQINTAVLDFLEKANLINPEQRANWERENYIPFNRVLEDMDTGDLDVMFSKSAVGRLGTVRKLKGGVHNIGDPLTNLVNTYSFLINEGLKNLARVKTIRLAKDTGLIEPTPKMPKKRGLTIRVQGKAQYYRVTDPVLYDAVVDVETMAHGIMTKGLSKILSSTKRWLTLGATIGPAFRIANFVRDTIFTSAMQNSFVPFVDSAKGFMHAFTKSAEFQEMASMGGAFSGAYHNQDVFVNTAKEVGKLKKRLKHQRNPFSPMRLVDLWERIGEASENAARFSTYKIQQRKGASKFDAAYAAKDLMDFHRTGKAGLLRFMTQSVPFLNARLQGLYKMGRTAIDPKTRLNFWTWSVAVGLASTLLYAHNKDKPEYKELNDSDKLMYWHVFDVPGVKAIRIPMPFELGSIAGALPVAMLETMAGSRSPKELGGFVQNLAMNVLSLNPTPQAVKPLIAQYANKNSFRGNPIVPDSELQAAPEVQYGPHTSKTSREIGKLLKISPRRMDQLIQDYFSYLGSFALYSTDQMLSWVKAYPEDPAISLGNRYLSGVGRFVKGKGEPKSFTLAHKRFYELYLEADKAFNTLAIYKKRRQAKKYREWIKTHRAELKLHQQLTPFQQRISQLNGMIRLTVESQKLSAKEKQDKIRYYLDKREQLFLKASNRYL